ncbi:MAG: LacI family DNA-binding transcriptional regulator [Actinomycetota bacterium]
MSPPRPTLKDVAERAGVSFKTVSRVVNGEPGVSEDMAARVGAAIEALGYRRNHSASSLRRAGARIGTIGVIHADIANPFAAAVHASFERQARIDDTLILAGSAGEDPEEQDRLVEAFIARQVDGLAVIPSGDDPGPALRRELQRGTPIVFIDRDPGVPADVVLSDHRGGAREATAHLLDHGHRRIGFLGSRERTPSVRQRRLGFDDAMKRIDGAISTVRIDLTSIDAAERAVEDLFADRGAAPTALFAAQNLAATGAVRGLHQLGLQHEIAIVAFDHIEIADIVDPGITTIPQRADELGRRAATLLAERIDGSTVPARREVVDVELLPRGSGELRPR